MKIEYVRLVNFIGIYNGMNRYNIEIDFSNNKNKVILLAGLNGGGKTTLLSCLSPFAETIGDNRSDIILDGTIGEKEIHIRHGKKLYKIYHNYDYKSKTRKTKSYIALKKKSGWEELNSNGSVTSFKEKLLEILDIDDSFFRLTRLGSNVLSFIDMKTAERKRFMSKFLSAIEEYEFYFKGVNQYWLELKKKIDSIIIDLNKIDTAENLQILLESLENQKTMLTDSIKTANTIISKSKGKISALDPDGNIEKEYNELISEIEKFEEELEETLSEISEMSEYDFFNEDVGVIKEEMNDTISEIASLKKEIESLEVESKDLNERIVRIKNSIKEKKIELSKVSSDRNLDELEGLLEKYNKKILTINSELETDRFKRVRNFQVTKEQVTNGNNVFSTYQKRVDAIKSEYSLSNIEEVLESDITIDKLDEKINNIMTLKRKVESNLKLKEKLLNQLSGKEQLAEILKQRPVNCKIDSCVFISEALRNKDVTSQINTLNDEISALESRLEKHDKAIEEIQLLKKCAIDISNVYQYIEDNKNIISKLPNWHRFESEKAFATTFLATNIDLLKDFPALMEMIESQDDITRINAKIPILKEKIETARNNKKFVDSIQKDITKLEDELEELNEKLTTADERKGESEEELEECESTLNLMKECIKYLELSNSLSQKLEVKKNEVKKNADVIEKISSSKAKIKANRVKESSLQEELKPIESKIDEVKHNIKKREELEEKKLELERDYGETTLVKDALSTTKGIPLIFIELYLQKIKEITNHLLSMTNIKMKIEKFELTESDFFIKVRKKDGELLKDVSIASQGEVSLSSVAISMGLMQQTVRNYNILLLDEIDSCLDQKNRRDFIEILEKQIEMLKIEQIFIISHNKEFDSYPVDLILFDGHGIEESEEFLMNKNVLFKV